MVRALDDIRFYIAHDDPAAATANLVALVIAANGPFYPFYLVHFAGRAVLWPSLLTMLASPLFLALPLLTRRSSRGGRLALPMLGAINTIWCLKLLGPGTAVGLFLLPCIALAALLFRRREGFLRLLAAAAPFAALLLPDGAYGVSLISFTPAATIRIASLNLVSVAALTFLLTFKFADLFRGSCPEEPSR
jgi:hypothetical protein